MVSVNLAISIGMAGAVLVTTANCYFTYQKYKQAKKNRAIGIILLANIWLALSVADAMIIYFWDAPDGGRASGWPIPDGNPAADTLWVVFVLLLQVGLGILNFVVINRLSILNTAEARKRRLHAVNIALRVITGVLWIVAVLNGRTGPWYNAFRVAIGSGFVFSIFSSAGIHYLIVKKALKTRQSIQQMSGPKPSGGRPSKPASPDLGRSGRLASPAGGSRGSVEQGQAAPLPPMGPRLGAPASPDGTRQRFFGSVEDSFNSAATTPTGTDHRFAFPPPSPNGMAATNASRTLVDQEARRRRRAAKQRFFARRLYQTMWISSTLEAVGILLYALKDNIPEPLNIIYPPFLAMHFGAETLLQYYMRKCFNGKDKKKPQQQQGSRSLTFRKRSKGRSAAEGADAPPLPNLQESMARAAANDSHVTVPMAAVKGAGVNESASSLDMAGRPKASSLRIDTGASADRHSAASSVDVRDGVASRNESGDDTTNAVAEVGSTRSDLLSGDDAV